jgi:predicted O-methyltransferase YrrM
LSPLAHFILWRLGLSAPQTQTSAEERRCLGDHARGRRRLAEIGVFQGVTTCVLKRAMHPDGLLLAIDPFVKGRLGVCLYEIIARREVGRVAGGRVRWIRARGAEAATLPAALPDERVDFIFIDGDHSWAGIRGDWEAWRDRIAAGGVVALRDSRETGGADSERYATEVILRDARFFVVAEVGRLTVLVRHAATRRQSSCAS